MKRPPICDSLQSDRRGGRLPDGCCSTTRRAHTLHSQGRTETKRFCSYMGLERLLYNEHCAFLQHTVEKNPNHKKISLNDGLMIQTAESIYTLHPAACKYGS